MNLKEIREKLMVNNGETIYTAWDNIEVKYLLDKLEMIKSIANDYQQGFEQYSIIKILKELEE